MIIDTIALLGSYIFTFKHTSQSCVFESKYAVSCWTFCSVLFVILPFVEDSDDYAMGATRWSYGRDIFTLLVKEVLCLWCSTLQLSLYSCKSEGSLLVKRDDTALEYSKSNELSTSSVRNPLSALAQLENGEDGKTIDNGEFVEMMLLDRSISDASHAKPQEHCLLVPQK